MKIILKSDRKLTDEEIIRFSKNKLIFQTVTSSHRGYDRFAGVSLSSRDTGVEDYISALSCRVEESLDKENEYIIFIEQTEEILGLDREHVGGVAGGKKLANFDKQLEYLKTTQLMQLFDENEIREQLEKIYEQEKKTYYYSTHKFSASEGKEILVEEIIDILSEMNLRKFAYSMNEKNEVCSFVKSDLVEHLSGNKKYQLMKFPCKILVRLEMDGHFKFVKCVENDRQENQDMNEILEKAETLYSLLNVLSEVERYDVRYYFVMPEEIYSEEEIQKSIKELELIQVRTKDIDDFSFEQVASLLGDKERDAFIKKYFDTHNVEQVIEKIKEIGDDKLLKRVLGIFSKHIDGREITSQQSDVIKEILSDTLNNNDGWKDNAKILSGVVGNIASSLTVDEKIQLLQASIDSHTRKCLADKNNEYHHDEYNMDISELINNLFSSEEQVILIDELLKQKNYQAMVLIINQCRYDGNVRFDGVKDKYEQISKKQKDKISEALIDSGEDKYLKGDDYVRGYRIDKEEKRTEKMSVFEELVKAKAFYVLGSDIFSDKDYRVKQEWIDKIAIKCFSARAGNAFENGYINIEEARKLIKNGKLHMDVPQKYMGTMIGKGGANIKELQDKLAKALEYDGDIRIIMHPQKEGKTITIEQLKSAIRENEKKLTKLN